MESLERVIVEHRSTVGAAMLKLLNTLDEWEKRQQERTPLMGDMCEKGCAKIAEDMVAQLKPGAHQPALVGPRELRYFTWDGRFADGMERLGA